MMNFKTEYKKQMDAFNEVHNMPSAGDILKKAKESETREKETVTLDFKKFEGTEEIKGRSYKKPVWKMAVSMACIIILATLTLTTTALAASGQLGEVLRKLFGDEITAELAEKGYIYEIGMSQSEDIFTVELVGVTGDDFTPKILFDVYIHDEAIAAENDRIYMEAYTLGVEQYENQLDHYGTCEAYGEKDENTNNLYHVTMDATPAWVVNGKDVVVAVCRINLDIDDRILSTYELNMEYRFTMGENSLYPANREHYDDIQFTYGGIEFRLIAGEYGLYRSEFIFHFNYEGTEIAGEETNYCQLEEMLFKNWERFISVLELVVDGEVYEVNGDGVSGVWCDTEGEALEKNTCSVSGEFPSVDYRNAQSIELRLGNLSYRLK